MLRILLKLSSLIARSWALSWCLYRLHGIRLVGPPGEDVWYFAYGANMHDSAFRGWRGMHPLEWRPGRVRGYRLRFNLEGHPGGRAAPANLSSDPSGSLGRPLQHHAPRPCSSERHGGHSVVAISAAMAGHGGHQRQYAPRCDLHCPG